MSQKQKAIFLTHRDLLHSKITGGVQLCSQEFHHCISACDDLNLKDYYVPFTKNIFQRVKMKLGFENYSMYDVDKDAKALLKYIESENISIVFLNMASCVRYAKPIKKKFDDKVKVILLSHGNHSGDFLHLITKPLKYPSLITRTINKIRLGNLISTEAKFRVKYLNGVIAISETEKQIENWFGAKRVAFLPRRLYSDFVNYKPNLEFIGFAARLDHPPNLQGITILLDEMSKHQTSGIKLRLVGAPISHGLKIAEKYNFVEYLGELSDTDLTTEITTWSFFINPVWWYSTGASTKLAKAISWGIPIITTTAGMRGYFWKTGNLLVTDTPEKMAKAILDETKSKEKIQYWSDQTKLVAENGLTEEEVTTILQTVYH